MIDRWPGSHKHRISIFKRWDNTVGECILDSFDDLNFRWSIQTKVYSCEQKTDVYI